MIRTEVARTSEEFLDLLQLRNPIWNIGIPGNTRWQSREEWGFRGQCDATWQMIPSAFRGNTIVGFKPDSAPPSSNPIDRKDEERRAVVDFLFFADRVGLRVPGDGQHFRAPPLPGHAQRVSLSHWPWEFALETLAIAQHHGVPTRLLDFSHSPTVAAFFACYDAWEQMGKPSVSQTLTDDRRLAVWAVHLPLIHKSVGHALRCGTHARMILVTAPRAENSFLHHQDGFFMVDLDADKYGYPPIEDVVQDVHVDMQNAGYQFAGDVVIKIEMEYHHVPRTLAHLWNAFYHIARIQPTHDKVVQALKDHRALYKP